MHSNIDICFMNEVFLLMGSLAFALAACPVCYLPMEDAIARIPNASSFSPILKNLSYVHEEILTTSEFGGSEFGGYPSLRQRSDSFDIKESMKVHCGFVTGAKPGQNTGYDIDDSDLLEMETCQGIVVASAIFGQGIIF